MKPDALLRQFGHGVGGFLNALFSSIAFLSRLPLYQEGDEVELPDFSKTTFAYPLAGMVIALPATIFRTAALLCRGPAADRICFANTRRPDGHHRSAP